MKTPRHPWADERGAALAEYALLAALIAGAAVAAVRAVATPVARMFQSGAAAFDAGPAQSGGGSPPPAPMPGSTPNAG